MRGIPAVLRLSLIVFFMIALGATLQASTIVVGYISWDVNFPANAGEFDIVNETGPVNGNNPTFPISNIENLSDLMLTVTFNDGSIVAEPSTYFTLSPDGESFDGTAIPIGGTNPIPVSATLTGDFSPLIVDLFGGGSDAILPTFTTTFSDSPTLVDGDLGIIYATTGIETPEPGTWMLAGLGILCLIAGRMKPIRNRKSAIGKSVVLLLALLVARSAFAESGFKVKRPSTGPQVSLNSWTAPSSGSAGITNVNITGTNFPTTGTITPANVVVTISATCDGAAVATAPASSLTTVIGNAKRVNFGIPAGLVSGTYFLTVADAAGGDADFTTAAGSCSQVKVIGTSPILNACLAGSSLAILLPAKGAAGNVTAYVPEGYWEGGVAGVFVQNIEGTIGSASAVSTPNVVNSCSSNPATQQTVCVANNTDVYILTGTTLSSTFSSGATSEAGFSGGGCENCGVAVNASNNTAVVNMGVSGSPSNDGVQILNLSNPSASLAPFAMSQAVSENISVDATRSLILSANEAANYVLLQIQKDGSLLEFDSTASTEGEADSSAEDCSTGIAIAPDEFTNAIFIQDLTQAVFTPGTPGTYTAPNTIASIVSSYGFSAGLCASAVAQGSGHLAMLTGEFGGSTAVIVQLPATSGSGTPNIVDYATFAIPVSEACGSFSSGFDPHTMTAYTSPNNGKSYGVFAGYAGSVPNCLAVVDMAAVLAAPRGNDGYSPHDVAPTDLPLDAVTFFPL
jgi:hypothetical protein